MDTGRSVRWHAVTGNGIEQLDLRFNDASIEAVGTVVGDRNEARFGLRYRIRCDRNWCVREAIVEASFLPPLHLIADGKGRWRKDSGEAIPALDGCVDVDIAATPYTNTLPIRRLGLSQGERRQIRVAYVSAPDLGLSPVDQAYTCITPMQQYRYEGLSSGFSTEITVDADGLVLEYPELFRRLEVLAESDRLV